MGLVIDKNSTCCHGNVESQCMTLCGRCRHPCSNHVPWGHGALCINAMEPENCNCRGFTDEPTGLGAMALAVKEQTT